ncbi:uncharacterized protein LOC126553337 [Aphis gossypii]|uniref:uncharacterized protein LOC126553337 n=1 Tax=Aphis gossypii TaxID=80765 RepID=UPI002159B285|nr:uncharacterized protein LOC126553337 [Aphis gossypii]
MNTMPEITTSVKNEISSKTLIISDNIPSLLTCTDNINNSEEPLIDNLIPEIIVNNFDSTISNDQMGICDKLRNWNVEFNVSHNCLNKLLNILKSEGLNVPKDGRTLMNTPKKHNILSMEPGAYVHFHINQIISSLLHKHEFDLSDITDLKLGINVDGLPISKSSKSQFWPILISICNVPVLSRYVLPVGIYHGLKKPDSSEDFLNYFLSDILNIMQLGIQINGKVFNVTIGHIVCDAPAKSYLLNVKGFNAYFGCNLCTDEGTYIDGRMAFLSIDSSLRTNESFRNKTNEYYHKGPSVLEKLPINITDDVPLDNMHCTYIGVMKKLIEFWVKGKKDVRLLDVAKNDINDSILNLKAYVPSEFSRLPRLLDDFYFWKATELRCFLLYYGQTVLKGKLKKKFYVHFLHLVTAIRILVTAETCISLNETAKILLDTFVNDYAALYGQKFINYNVHSLIHLPYFVLKHGPLESFSCFKYENYLQEIKKFMKCSRFPLQEVSNRIYEKLDQIKNTPESKYPKLSKELHKTHHLLSDRVYEKVGLENFSTININSINNNFIMLKNNDLVFVEQILMSSNNEIKFLVKKCNSFSSFFNLLNFSSKDIGSYIINLQFLSTPYLIQVNDFKCKCFYIQISGNKAVVITLCHNFDIPQ